MENEAIIKLTKAVQQQEYILQFTIYCPNCKAWNWKFEADMRKGMRRFKARNCPICGMRCPKFDIGIKKE